MKAKCSMRSSLSQKVNSRPRRLATAAHHKRQRINVEVHPGRTTEATEFVIFQFYPIWSVVQFRLYLHFLCFISNLEGGKNYLHMRCYGLCEFANRTIKFENNTVGFQIGIALTVNANSGA